MSKNKLKGCTPLILILIVAAILRFGLLGKYPVSLNVDEVAIGYDAFSILNTGRDIHKNFLPLVFESLGDYKPGLYIYSACLSEIVFGLNEFSIRFPAALAGLLTVLFLYLTVMELTGNKRLSLVSAWVLALSPWHLKLSRGAFEATLALCLLLVGFYLTLVAIRKLKKMNWGIIFFALSMHAYHSEKIIAPLLLLSMVCIFREKIRGRKILRWWFLTLVIVLFPFIFTLGNNSQSRLQTKFVLNDPEISIFLSRETSFFGLDKLIVSANIVFKRYIEFLDFGYTLNKGLDLTRSSSFDVGWIYWLEFPFLVCGVVLLIKNRDRIFKEKKYLYCFVAWILLSSLPASITMDDYHIYRLLTLTIPFSFVIALGINKFLDVGERRCLGKLFLIIILLIYSINLLYFINYYFVHYPLEKSDWQFDPSKEVALTVLENINKYDKIVVDPYFGKDGPNIVGVPDLYILFYGKIRPQQFWSEITNNGFKNIEFRKIEWNLEKEQKNVLLVGSPWSLPINEVGSSLVKRINYFNGDAAYYTIETAKDL